MNPQDYLQQDDALIFVDVQNDFCAGGTLEVPGGDQVIPVLNEWMRTAAERGIPVVASRDWHPVHHVSFTEQGGPWPVHCVQDTRGAEYHPHLELPAQTARVCKGTRFDRDAYSAFDNTGLGGYLPERGVRRLWVGGLAEDICVLNTVLQAREEGFETHVIMEATRAVDPAGGEKAARRMRDAGAMLT